MLDANTSSDPWVFDVTARDFDERVAKSSVPVMVDFWAPWCGPCQQIAPMLDNIAQRYQGRFHVAKVNVDEETTLATGFGVRSIPMLVLFANGQVVETIVGLQPEQELIRLIEPHVARAPNSLRKATQDALLSGDHASALTLLEQALAQEPENGAIRVDLARCELALGNHEEALGRLKALPDDIESSRDVQALRVEITLARDAVALQQTDSPLAPALKLAADRQFGAAIDALLAQSTQSDEALRTDAKQHLIRIFDLLGSADERVQQGRRALASLLN